jgi:hypothetical protein
MGGLVTFLTKNAESCVVGRNLLFFRQAGQDDLRLALESTGGPCKKVAYILQTGDILKIHLAEGKCFR